MSLLCTCWSCAHSASGTRGSITCSEYRQRMRKIELEELFRSRKEPEIGPIASVFLCICTFVIIYFGYSILLEPRSAHAQMALNLFSMKGISDAIWYMIDFTMWLAGWMPTICMYGTICAIYVFSPLLPFIFIYILLTKIFG